MSETKEEVVKEKVVTDCDKSILIDSEGKNSKSLSCNNCDCLLLRPNIAQFVEIEVLKNSSLHKKLIYK